jgi:death-on-curing protein
MKEPRWIDRRALLLLHHETLAEHGGLPGIRDEGLLDSALARPRQVYAYENDGDVARLAGACAVGLARNRPVADGNKRAAFLALGLFLGLNGYGLAADKAEATVTMLGVAAGQLSEADFGSWVRAHMKRKR